MKTLSVFVQPGWTVVFECGRSSILWVVVSTRVAVTPQVLRQLVPPSKRHTVKMSPSGSTLLLQWINEAGVIRTKRSPDCRWGLLFMDRDGNEVASIFSDRWGTIGNVNGHNVEFSGPPLLVTIQWYHRPVLEEYSLCRKSAEQLGPQNSVWVPL